MEDESIESGIGREAEGVVKEGGRERCYALELTTQLITGAMQLTMMNRCDSHTCSSR